MVSFLLNAFSNGMISKCNLPVFTNLVVVIFSLAFLFFIFANSFFNVFLIIVYCHFLFSVPFLVFFLSCSMFYVSTLLFVFCCILFSVIIEHFRMLIHVNSCFLCLTEYTHSPHLHSMDVATRNTTMPTPTRNCLHCINMKIILKNFSKN